MMEFQRMSVRSDDAVLLLGELNKALIGIIGNDGTVHLNTDDFGQDKAAFFVGYDGGRPVCCAGVRYMDEDTGEVKRVFARNNAKGYGAALMAELEAFAREVGYRRLVLECREKNSHALAFYEKLGYRVCESYPPYDKEPDAVCMEKQVRKISMIKNVAIVSLSSGTIGEDFAKHEVELGLKRLKDYGLNVKMMPHAQSGIAYVKEHPEDRADDLLRAFADASVDMIFCAIGGDDTYRLLPYLFENGRLQKAVKDKVFLGFSDTTINHLMLHKVGLNTFYGQSFLADVCELDTGMLPYTAGYFEELIRTGTIKEICPSDVWYEERTDWSEAALGTARVQHSSGGFQLLQGAPMFSGKILGGCLDSLFDIFDATRYPDTVSLCEKYGLFPDLDDWKGKILLLETSEEQPVPEHYREMLLALKKTGIFGVINGVLCGKPMDEKYFEEYKKILVEVIDDPALPVIVNLNIGHATPRCIIPFGVEAVVDAGEQVIRFG